MERATGARGDFRVGLAGAGGVEGERELVELEREVEEARILVREVERRTLLVEHEIVAVAPCDVQSADAGPTPVRPAVRRSAVLGSVFGVGAAVVATALIEVLTQWLR